MIKAVIFDMDGVLLDSFDANLDFFQRLMVKAGYPVITREQYLAEGFHRSMVDVIKNHIKDVSNEEMERILDFRRSKEILPNPSLLSFPEDLDSVLETLSKNYQLGIATSRIKEGVYNSPRTASLKKYFSATVAYEDTQNHKPHPEPLLFAAQGLKVKPEECIYIGDAESDVIAAHAAGMKCIIYSKNQIKEADAQTADFKEIPKLIEGLVGREK